MPLLLFSLQKTRKRKMAADKPEEGGSNDTPIKKTREVKKKGGLAPFVKEKSSDSVASVYFLLQR